MLLLRLLIIDKRGLLRRNRIRILIVQLTSCTSMCQLKIAYRYRTRKSPDYALTKKGTNSSTKRSRDNNALVKGRRIQIGLPEI